MTKGEQTYIAVLTIIGAICAAIAFGTVAVVLQPYLAKCLLGMP